MEGRAATRGGLYGSGANTKTITWHPRRPRRRRGGAWKNSVATRRQRFLRCLPRSSGGQLTGCASCCKQIIKEMSEHPTWQRSLGDYTSAVKAEIRGRAFCGIPFLDETATGVSDPFYHTNPPSPACRHGIMCLAGEDFFSILTPEAAGFPNPSTTSENVDH